MLTGSLNVYIFSDCNSICLSFLLQQFNRIFKKKKHCASRSRTKTGHASSDLKGLPSCRPRINPNVSQLHSFCLLRTSQHISPNSFQWRPFCPLNRSYKPTSLAGAVSPLTTRQKSSIGAGGEWHATPPGRDDNGRRFPVPPPPPSRCSQINRRLRRDCLRLAPTLWRWIHALKLGGHLRPGGVTLQQRAYHRCRIKSHAKQNWKESQKRN